jgi:iron complex outermembrane recepter protein
MSRGVRHGVVKVGLVGIGLARIGLARVELALVALLVVVGIAAPPPARAQSPASSATSSPAQTGVTPTPLRINAPDIVVSAVKEPQKLGTLPVSATTITSGDIALSGISTVSDAGIYAPNTFFTEFTARKLSFPRFRGIGTSPSNPGITTNVDGVPQLNANTSSTELLGVEQIEFVRGPQSALFGRNTLGGVINIASARPSLQKWAGSLSAPLGNVGAKEIRGSAGGPLGSRVAVGLALGRSVRDGFNTNDISGNLVDSRAATFGKFQVLWTPTAKWEVRAIASGERARDGDYGLNDLAALRSRPFRVARDFEGHTERDVLSTTILTRRDGDRISLATTTGVVRWKTQDQTDLDYTPLPLLTRDNAEEATQFTQEVRVASNPSAAVTLGSSARLRWQAGAFVFTQGAEQDAVNKAAPFVFSPLLPFAVSQHSPQSALDDVGIGVYGQGTITLRDRFDVQLGARIDHERKDAVLDTFYEPRIAPPTRVVSDRAFSKVSPQVALTYRLEPERMVYTSVGRGFKAGGFNPASPSGLEAYGEELTWNIEAGTKASWVGGRVHADASVFHIRWDDLQLNLPNPAVPAQFYIANVGGARSSGAELDLGVEPISSLNIFGIFGYTRARFGDGSVSSGADVSGKALPSTPEFTATVGAQLSRKAGSAATLYARGEAVFLGHFFYDDGNTQGQDAYSLANGRVGIRGQRVFAEGWIKNAFDTRYIPLAFAYGPFAPSGFVGEMGRPRTFGLSAGVSF